MPIDSGLNSAPGNQTHFFSKVGAWYLEKQPNLKKWSEIEKKKAFGTYSRKTGKFWDQTFLTGTCPRIVRLQ